MPLFSTRVASLVTSLILSVAKPSFGAPPDGYAGRPFTDAVHQTGPASIPGIVQCALFDLGGEGIAYHDTTPTNEGSNGLNRETTPHNHQRGHGSPYIWHFRSEEAVDISYVKDFADLNHANPVAPPVNQHYLGWAADGEWVNYTVDVKEPGTYLVNCLYSYAEMEVSRDASGQPVGEIRFELNGMPAAECALPRATGGWHTWDFGPIARITFAQAGLHVLTFHYRRGNNWAYFIFERDRSERQVSGETDSREARPSG